MGVIIAKAKTYCLDLLRNSRCGNLPYHNEQHTLDVYKNARRIAYYEDMSEEEMEPVLLAALFHDTGNALTFKGHEDLSASNAILFLENERYDEALISKVVHCINATKIPQAPFSKLERIICDADLYHLGSKDFFVLNEKLRTEWESYQKKYYSDIEWYTMNIDFLQNHDFHTTYGKLLLEPIKLKNIGLFESLLSNMELI